jgi:hypothetical protein
MALSYGRRALAMAQKLETQAAESQPLCCVGHALLALQRPQEATAAYMESVRLHRMIGNEHLAMEPIAGLIRVALSQGNLAEAKLYAHEIMAHLAQGMLDGTAEPIRVQLTLYQALLAIQAPPADAHMVLTAAYQMLMTRADKISDPLKKQLFLTNISTHRTVQEEWHQHH